MPSFTFFVSSDGKLPIGIKETLARVIPTFAAKKVTLSITESKEKSSDKQRRYYFGVIVEEFIKHFSTKGNIFTKEQMHDSMMRSIGGFNNPYVNPFTGEPDDGRLSYNDLTTAQTEGYHTLCLEWAAKEGFQIPLPNEDLTAYE